MAKKYEKTVKAFLSEEGSLWGIVDALSEEMPGDCSASDLGACREYLAGHDIDKSVNTIKSYRITGRYLEESTPAQVRLFRTQSVSTISQFAGYGASPEAAAETIRRYRADTGRKRMPHSAARAVFAQDGSPILSTAPEDWTAEQWRKFDAQVVTATKTVLMALNTWQRGLYEPSVEAIAQLSLIKPADLDAELVALLADQ